MVTNLNATIAPRFSHVRERIAYENIEKLDHQTPKTHHEKRDIMGDIYQLFSLLKSKETQKIYFFAEKELGDKLSFVQSCE